MNSLINAHLIKTVDKAELVATLKQWREEATSKDEASVIAELLERIYNGELDG